MKYLKFYFSPNNNLDIIVQTTYLPALTPGQRTKKNKERENKKTNQTKFLLKDCTRTKTKPNSEQNQDFPSSTTTASIYTRTKPEPDQTTLEYEYIYIFMNTYIFFSL